MGYMFYKTSDEFVPILMEILINKYQTPTI